jgi:hypothetical protein
MSQLLRRTAPLSFCALLLSCATAAPRPAALPAPDAGFAETSARLSEPGGFFPSDNLVSNETSYLHVLGKMTELGVRGGAYVGVGPDQSFSYIAHVRPEVAFIIDIRRDNMLHHLLFKALFEHSRNRIEYLSMLLGRTPPADLEEWNEATVDQIVEYVRRAPAPADRFAAMSARILATATSYGIPLSDIDTATIRRIHLAFFSDGLDIRYSYSSRHPNYARLLLETDLDGNKANYLASEENFRYLKELQRRNRVIPVVGDLGGPHALAAVGREIAARGLRISAFYVSNVEQYLMRGPGFEAFAQSVAGLPFDENSVMIRSYFGGFRAGHPNNVAGHSSTQLLELFRTFVDTYRNGGYRDYMELVTLNVLPNR